MRYHANTRNTKDVDSVLAIQVKRQNLKKPVVFAKYELKAGTMNPNLSDHTACPQSIFFTFLPFHVNLLIYKP